MNTIGIFENPYFNLLVSSTKIIIVLLSSRGTGYGSRWSGHDRRVVEVAGGSLPCVWVVYGLLDATKRLYRGENTPTVDDNDLTNKDVGTSSPDRYEWG